MAVVYRKFLLMVGALACGPTGPDGSRPDAPGPEDTDETAAPADTVDAVDTVDTVEDTVPAISPEVLAALPAGILATVQAAALVTPAQLYDLVRLTRSVDHPECSVKVEDGDAFEITSDCVGPGDVVVGQIRGFQGPIGAPTGPELVWVQRWLPAFGETADPGQPAASPVAFVSVLALYLWSDDSGPILRLFGTYGALEGMWGDVHAVRVWADGPAYNRLADAASWTGGALEADRLELGRLRSPSAALLTIDGAFGGLAGRFGATEVLGGAWWAEGTCTREPSGIWSLRDEDGRWYDVAFDGVCDGCGVVTSAGLAPAVLCLDAALVSQIGASVQETVP